MTATQPVTRTLVLGIDTGGTYTDGVLLDYHTREVIASCKSLTTRHDYAEGIGKVIEGIQIDNPAEVKMVSISTTLATNAIAEGKGARVALILIGYDKELAEAFQLHQRFGTTQYAFFAGGHTLFGEEKEPLDLEGILDYVHRVKDSVDALAVSAYFSPMNPEHELRAFEAISRICDLPVVLGHQLSTKLGSVERATTAALNASLLGMLKDFIIAVRRAMEARHIHAPLMVVRGDGTLMSEEFAARTPVETIHSGPAASAMGGRFLSRVDTALVVDVGGTTTDIALIEDGRVQVSEEGATVGNYKTCVQAANILSIALGGDSHIHIGRDQKWTIGPARVVPLAYLASQYPAVKRRIAPLLQKGWGQIDLDQLEFWFLQREPSLGMFEKGSREAEVVALLREGPMCVTDIVRRLKLIHAGQIGAAELWRQEIIGRAGLTPTDFMHLDGIYKAWDAEMSEIAAALFCRNLGMDVKTFHNLLWQRIDEIITEVILSFLTGKQLAVPDPLHDVDMGRWFFRNSIQASHPHLETTIRLKVPIIGIGAPAKIFLERVADIFHTELILPPYYWVANAVGAVAGSVMVSEEALVYARLSEDQSEVVGYYVQTSEGRAYYESLEEALGFARERVRTLAWEGAVRAGAHSPQVTLEEVEDGLDTYRIRARAMGTPRLA